MSKSIDWNKFYENTWTREVHPILKLAMEFFQKPGIAYDMGAGSGVDTFYLLKNGWKVHAVDVEQSALDFMAKKMGNDPSLVLELSSFENLRLQKCNLIFGASSFPFCSPEYFDRFWNNMIESLEKGGIICGTFIGPKDEWADRPGLTIQNEESLLKLFMGLDILFFDEIEDEIETPMGRPRHRHMYSFILRT